MDGSDILIEQFGIGQPVRRREDQRFLTGAGHFTDDIDLPGQAWGYVLRSPHAHARIRSLDTAAAKAAPGVLAIYTIADLDAEGIQEIPTQAKVAGRDGSEMFAPTRPVLARGAVRFVGDPVAYVVAESLEQSRDVGGGFGLRGKTFPESVLVLFAAKRLGRPVKWRADRQETFLCDVHGRDHVTRGEMAFDKAGKLLAMRIENIANVGAYLSDNGPRVCTAAGARVAGTVYDVPALQLSVRVTFTNTVPVCAYRGAGRPEVAYQMERLLDQGSRALGLGRDEIRRRNFIRPEQLPYKNRVGLLIDSGHFQETMEKALAHADWAGFEARRAEARRHGKLRGIGLGYYCEAPGGQPTEQAIVKVAPDGRVTLIMGTFSHGQGHETAFSQIVAQKIGVPFEMIDFRQGDTEFVKVRNGTGGSRSSQMGGVATARACDQVIEKAKRLAAHALEAAAADITFNNGAFEVVGTDLRMSLPDVAALAQYPR